MTKGITFHSSKKANEYCQRQKKKGFNAHVCNPERGVYTIEITGKLKEPKRNVLMLKSKTVEGQYKEAKRMGIVPWKTKAEIKKIATEELRGANIKIPVKITRKLFIRPAAAAIRIEGKGDKEKKFLLIHPLAEYQPVAETRYMIKHEIRHIKERR